MFFKKLLVFVIVFSNILLANASCYNVWEAHKASYVDQIETQKMGIAFSLLPLTCQNIVDFKGKIVENSIWSDYNFFYGNARNSQKHILNQINRTKTKVGYATLANRLTQVETNIDELQSRQLVVKELTNEECCNQILKYLNEFSELESSVEYILDTKKLDDLEKELKYFYFQPYKPSNERLSKLITYLPTKFQNINLSKFLNNKVKI